MNLIQRNFKLAIDSTTIDTSREISITAFVVGTLPLLSMSQHSVGSVPDETVVANINYDRALFRVGLPTPLGTDFKNHPIDPDKPGRFVPVSIIANTATGFNFYLYYDTKYQDLILLPNLRMIGDDTTSAGYFSNREIQVDAYRVGVPSNKSEFSGLTLPRDEPTHDLPTPTPLASAVLHHMALFINKQRPLFENVVVKTTTGYLESTAIPSNPFISLGDSTSLFGKDIEVMRVISNGGNRVTFIKTKQVTVSDVLIPLP